MKTPRELLLETHRHQEAQLNAIRGEVVRAMGARSNREMPHAPSGISFLTTCWQELFVQCRRYWTGLGIAWALVLVLAVAGTTDDSRAGKRARAGESVIEAMQARQQLCDELLGLAVMEQAQAAPRDPGPRSEAIRQERYV